MQKKNIFDLYNEQHKDDGKAADKLPGEVTAADVEPEQEAAPEPEQKPEKEPEQKPKKEPKEEPKTEPTPEHKTDAVQENEKGGAENV